MTDFFKQIETMLKFSQAIEAGVEKTIASLPIIARQQINSKARNKFHSTLETYMDAVQTKFDQNFFIIELEKDNWLANALEVGKSPYDMKNGLLNSPKAKMGKDGKRFIHIPIQKDAKRKSHTMGTEKAQEYQRLIEHVMRKPKYGASSVQHKADGTVIESQKLMTSEPKLQGMYRFRKLDSARTLFGGKTQGIPFQHVMFRTVSENPSKTGATWEHPGFSGANIFKAVERELPLIFETLLDQNIQSELQGMF